MNNSIEKQLLGMAVSQINVDTLSNFIRFIDGSNTMGAGVLAEKILDWMKMELNTKIQTHNTRVLEPSRWDGPCYSAAETGWCKMYEQITGFEPLMDDFEQAMAEFATSARNSIDWYENHTTDCLNKVCSMPIPGIQQELI